MKRIINSIITLLLAITLVLLPVANVKAAENTSEVAEKFGSPISISTYVDENGYTVTERIYFKPDSGMVARDKSGSGWYMNEKTYEYESGIKTTYYAKGHFVWGNGNVSVSDPSGDIYNVPNSITVSNKSTTSGTGKYGCLFNNFAYVTFSCTATNMIGMANDFSVTIRISESGNAI